MDGFRVELFFCVMKQGNRERGPLLCSLPACFSATDVLTHAAIGGITSNVVDTFNIATWSWATAQLSVAREMLAATSVGNEAIFAGGHSELFVENYSLLRILVQQPRCIVCPNLVILSYSLGCSWNLFF